MLTLISTLIGILATTKAVNLGCGKLAFLSGFTTVLVIAVGV